MQIAASSFPGQPCEGARRREAEVQPIAGAAQLEGHTDPDAEAVARVFEFLAT